MVNIVTLKPKMYIDSRGNWFHGILSYEKHDISKKKLTDHNGDDISDKLKDSYIIPELFVASNYETHGEPHDFPWQVIYHAAKLEHKLNILLEQD